ncbi:MAG: GGDEF domain-containing protein [Lachnospiraceae bacterium]|nr:GGDEF domain-containing protein [Lachnospiraceae bacterium]
MDNNDMIFNKIAEALLIDYSSVYYVNAVTNEYKWYSINSEFSSLQIEKDGKDFFKNMARDAEQVVYEEDKHIFKNDIQKENLLSKMKDGNMHSIVYRLVIDGKPVWHTLRLIREVSGNDDYFILGVLNIDNEMRMKEEAQKLEKEREIFNQIAEGLAANYDVIYYVDSKSGVYSEYTSNSIYGNLEINEAGNDFFAESQVNADQLVHPDDMERVKYVLSKDYIISSLEDKKRFSADYRLMIDGKPQYTRLTMMWASDRIHFIIGVENITEEVIKENEHMTALKSANEMARRDELTGAKNKNAYHELETAMQENIDNGIDYFSFAIVVCDLNDLKIINDTMGHKAGDEYIKTACQMICDIYAHSPVFRVGGDEFAVVLSERDYSNKDKLLEKLRGKVLENLSLGNGPVLASGMAEYDTKNKTKVSEIFNQADVKMYDNKKELKNMKREI